MFDRPGKGEPERVPTADDFSSKAVNRAVLVETVQHSATTVPAAIAAVCGMWWVLIAPNPTAIGLCLLTGFTSVASWVTNYFLRGETFAEKHIAKLRAFRERHKRTEAGSLREDFGRQNFHVGVNAVTELSSAYQKLYTYLRERMAMGKNLSAERFLMLAEDTYDQGLQILQKALYIFQTLESIDAEKLEREVEEWRVQLEELRKEGGDEHRSDIETLTTIISSNEKRLQRYREREEEMQKLLAECERLEGALESACLDILDLVGTGDKIFTDGSASRRLETAVTAARRVEERLRGYGDTRSEDEMYLEAGRTVHKNQEE